MRLRGPCCLLAALAACEAPPLDTTRIVPERGTLGEEVFRLFHRDLVREAPRRAEGFAMERAAFVGAVDHLFPDGELSEVQDFMLRLLERYDDDTIPELTRRIARVVERLEGDRDAVRSLTTLSNRTGYIAKPEAHALALRLARFPHFAELSNRLLDLALAHDGLDDGGRRDEAESDILRRLLIPLAEALRDLEISEDAERDAVLLAKLLLSEDPRLSFDPSGPSIVSRDLRGLAMVQRFNGAVPTPFVDRSPADGLADVDLDGRFVDASGAVIDVPPYGDTGARDQSGRAVSVGRTELVYQHVALERTVLGGVARDTRELIRRGLPMKGVRTLEAFLGERDPQGLYSAPGNALVELTHALAQAIDIPELPELLEVAEILFERHPDLVLHLMNETRRQLEVADRYDVSLRPGNSFFDDLMSVVRKILREPGLMEAVLVALEDPAALRFPSAQAVQSRHKKPRITAEDFDRRRVFTTPVDFATADRPGNQSIFQRQLHLLFDTKGARYEPRFVGLPLGFIFQIEDLAEFYLLSIIGESRIPALVSTLTGLPEVPGPEDLARFINTNQQFGNPKGNEGLDVMNNDGDTLFATSASGLADALRPFVRTFHRAGKLHLLFELFEVLHLHWASPESDYQSASRSRPRYSKLSGLRYYEPLLIDVFENTHVLAGVQKLLIDTKNVRTASGKSARDVLLAFGRKLMNKDSLLLTHAGERQVMVNGQRVTPLSPFDLARGALDQVDAVVARRAVTKLEWDEIADFLDESFAKTEATGPFAARFVNGRTLPVLSHAIRFLKDRAVAQARKGTLSRWVKQELVGHLVDAITAPELPAALDLLHTIDEDARLSELLIQLRDELLDDDKGFGELLVLLGDRLSSAQDASLGVPFANFLGQELHPEGRLLFQLARNTKILIEADGQGRLLETARRGMELAPDGELYIDGILRAVKQANRVNPLATGPVEAEDTRLFVNKVHTYMLDGEHGLEKFIELVKNRK